VAPVRAHFVNENVGGHATLHQAVRAALVDYPEVAATFFDVPPPSLARRLVSARVPGASTDWDLQPLRDQLAKSAVVRAHLSRCLGGAAAPEVLHVYTHNVALLSPDLLRRVPSVVSLDATNRQNAYRLPQHRPGRMTPVLLRPTMALERRVYDAATRVVAQSSWAATSLHEDYGIDADRVVIIPFGITVPPPPARPDTGAGGLPRITFIGRSMDRKGGWRLLEVWRRHLRDRSRLTLVTLDAVASEPGLEVRNDVRPGDGQAERLLAETDVFAFPTELDTFGYAAIEAMAAEVPVVATRTAGVPEVVEDGVTGLLVDVGDDEALTEALVALLDDPDRRRRLGTAGRRRVLERFDARVTTRALLEVLAEAVSDAGGRR
jgi:glycosyltransferase involved in cell wall biosynthesis